METNQTQAQGQSAQRIASETPQPDQQPASASDQQSTPQAESQMSPAPEPASAKELYNPDEAAEIVKHLTHGLFDPEYILLFGKLAGGTPHSDPVTYDILMVTRETPAYDWMQVKRYLRYQMPIRRREISYINLYILPLSYLESHNTPFLYFAHSEGRVLYCNDHHYFRTKKQCNFAAAYADAKLHFDTFSDLGMFYLERANTEYTEGCNLRPAALFTAQAAVYFYHTLYYVYHGMEFDVHDPVLMHERMRTLSAELMLTLDDNHIENSLTMPCLKGFMQKVAYNRTFDVEPKALALHMERVEKMGGIIQRLCELRLEMYKERSEK